MTIYFKKLPFDKNNDKDMVFKFIHFIFPFYTLCSKFPCADFAAK